MYENFNSYKIGDVISDIYDINYILDEQNISAYYSFLKVNNINKYEIDFTKYEIGSTDINNRDTFLNKLSDEKFEDVLKTNFNLNEIITISFYDNNINPYHQVKDINDGNRDKLNSYFSMLSEHLEPFSGLSVEMKPYRLYNSAQEVVTIIVKRIKL